jgi:alkanesulfonate monooxygenase
MKTLPAGAQVSLLARPHQQGPGSLNVVTTAADNVHGNFGIDAHPPGRALRTAREFVEVVQGLWDSFEDDAFVCARRLRRVFRSAQAAHPQPCRQALQGQGTLNMERPPGHPVIVQAGSSEDGEGAGGSHRGGDLHHA